MGKHRENSGQIKNRHFITPFRWKPGQTGNPNGRPKKQPITERYLQALEVVLPDDIRIMLGMRKGSTVGDAIARKMVIKALNGSVDAAREIADRVEGKPAQAVRLEGDALLPAPTFNILFRGDYGAEQNQDEISGQGKRLAAGPEDEDPGPETTDEGL